MPVANCARCKKIYQRTMDLVCPSCHQHSLDKTSMVYQYIQEHPGLSVKMVASQCKIATKELEEILLSGKLGTAANLVLYHCQCCSQILPASLLKGRFCSECADTWEIKAGLHEKNLSEKPLEKQEPLRSGTTEKTNNALKNPIHPHDEKPQEIQKLKIASQAETASALKDAYGFKRVSS